MIVPDLPQIFTAVPFKTPLCYHAAGRVPEPKEWDQIWPKELLAGSIFKLALLGSSSQLGHPTMELT